MPNISGFHTALVTLHVLGVIVFLMAHGVSAAVLLRIRSERDPNALRALLDLSRRTMIVMSVGFLVWFLAGIAAGFSGNWWTSGRWWSWVSLAIAIVVTAVMTPLGRFYLDRVRVALGLDKKTGALDPTFNVDPAAVDAAIASGRPALLAAIGVGALIVLGWLMVAKPF